MYIPQMLRGLLLLRDHHHGSILIYSHRKRSSLHRKGNTFKNKNKNVYSFALAESKQIKTDSYSKEALEVLMLCAPSNHWQPFSYHKKMADRVFSCFLCFLLKKIGINSEKCILNMVSSDSQIDKPQRGHPKRAELSDVNINTGAHKALILREFV